MDASWERWDSDSKKSRAIVCGICCWGWFAFIIHPGLGTAPPSPASYVVSSSWVVLAESPDLSQGTLEIAGRPLWHKLVHAVPSILSFGDNQSTGHFSLYFFHLLLQNFRQGCAWGEGKEVVKSKWSSPVGRGSSWAWALDAEAIWRRPRLVSKQ